MTLPTLLIAFLSTCSQSKVASSLDHWKILRQFEPPASAASKEQLIDVFKGRESYFTVEEARYRGTDYLFFTVDKGSGMYLIYGYLYQMRAGHAFEVLRLYPQISATKLTIAVEGNKLTLKAVMPKKRLENIGDYIMSEQG